MLKFGVTMAGDFGAFSKYFANLKKQCEDLMYLSI